jgi:hypothetical protein
VPRELVEQSREYVKMWLNRNVLSSNILAFPEQIVENGGAQLFELLNFIAG